MSTTASEHRSRPRDPVPAPGVRRAPVLAGQVLGSLGLGAAGAAGALLITAQSGSDRLAAAPLGAVVLGGALSAWPVARRRSRSGRTASYAVAFLVAGLGAFLVLAGAATRSTVVLVGGHVLIGAGNTAVMLSRYLVADLVPPEARARAIGRSFLAMAGGAVVGPALLGPAAVLAMPLGLPAPAGLYVVSLVTMLAASVVLATTSRRQPATTTATTATTAKTGARPQPSAAPVQRGPRGLADGALPSVLSMGTANLTMVSLMAVIPLHLGRHGHSLEQIGWAVSAHVAAMFLGSSLFGPVTARLGSRLVASGGHATLAGAATAAVLLPIDSLRTGMLLLVTLGLGWGAVVVANSTRLSTLVAQESRGSLEAASEITMSVGAVVGCFALAGPLVEMGGVPLLAAVLVPLHLGAWVKAR